MALSDPYSDPTVDWTHFEPKPRDRECDSERSCVSSSYRPRLREFDNLGFWLGDAAQPRGPQLQCVALFVQQFITIIDAPDSGFDVSQYCFGNVGIYTQL